MRAIAFVVNDHFQAKMFYERIICLAIVRCDNLFYQISSPKFFIINKYDLKVSSDSWTNYEASLTYLFSYIKESINPDHLHLK